MCRIIIYPKARLSWSRLAQMRNSTDLPQRVSRSIVIGFIFITHFCDCTVKTELIYRSNCAKNSCNRFLVGTKWIDICPPPLLLSTPLDNGLVARKTGCPLSASVTIIFSAILSHSPCGLSSLIEYHFFSEPGPINDHCPVPNLFAKRNEIDIWHAFFFMVSWSTWGVVEHRH